MKSKFVLDTNCIIDLEKDQESSSQLRVLVDVWREGRIDLAVVAVSASENQKDGLAGSDYAAFKTTLHRAGLAGADILLPLMKWDVSLWGHALWTDQEMSDLADRFYHALFPSSVHMPPTDPARNSKWRNKLCDAVIAWACVYHNWPCLITSDENFHRRAGHLHQLGLKEILRPGDAAKLCES